MKERLAELIVDLGVKKKDFAEKIDVSTGNLSDWLKDRYKPTTEALAKISGAYGVNLKWLLTGEGRKFLNDEESHSETFEIPLVGMVAAGRLLLEDMPIENKFVLPGLKDKHYIALRVVGNSMQPIIEQDDILIVKQIDRTQIKTGRVYVIVHREGTAVKKIFKERDHLRCASYNQNVEPEFKVTDVRSVYKIVRHIHPYRDFLFP